LAEGATINLEKPEKKLLGFKIVGTVRLLFWPNGSAHRGTGGKMPVSK
jgi:hypothetical protein